MKLPCLGHHGPCPLSSRSTRVLSPASRRLFLLPLDPDRSFCLHLFLYLVCFFPLASILSSIGLRGIQMVPSLALFAASPLYVFVSRLFLIESTALFFSLLYADQMFRLVLGQRRWQARHIAGGAVFGVLAGLVKVTTFAPFFVLGTCLAAWGLWKDRERESSRVDILLEVTLCCLALPVAATSGWTRFADGVKAQNPIGIFLISRALRFVELRNDRPAIPPSSLSSALSTPADNHIGNIADSSSHPVGVHLDLSPMELDCCGVFGALRGNHPALLQFARCSRVLSVFQCYFSCGCSWSADHLGSEHTGEASLGRRRPAGLRVGSVRGSLLHSLSSDPDQNAPGRPEAATLVDTTTTPQSVILITGLRVVSRFSVSRAIVERSWMHSSPNTYLYRRPRRTCDRDRRSKKHNRTHSLRSRP